MYGYFPAVDYQEAVDLVFRAQEMFSELPGSVRENFANDPAALLAFVEDANNGPAEFEAMGLKVAEPSENPPVQPTATNPRALDPGDQYQKGVRQDPKPPEKTAQLPT